MSWFTRLCRQAGLTVHSASKALQGELGRKQEVKRSVEEKKISETTVLRRTTIEEIEIHERGNDAE